MKGIYGFRAPSADAEGSSTQLEALLEALHAQPAIAAGTAAGPPVADPRLSFLTSLEPGAIAPRACLPRGIGSVAGGAAGALASAAAIIPSGPSCLQMRGTSIPASSPAAPPLLHPPPGTPPSASTTKDISGSTSSSVLIGLGTRPLNACAMLLAPSRALSMSASLSNGRPRSERPFPILRPLAYSLTSGTQLTFSIEQSRCSGNTASASAFFSAAPTSSSSAS
mmetsp:Transcript_48012/g.95812  ORF Transcript_48012/g.95812 Transcript_48012/m.95812 type:complete len:224 (-) Transcript_48012:22-693(-)